MTGNAGARLNNPFIALKHKNFRLYWIGMCISLIGTWMQNIAQPWLAYSITNSPLLLSFVSAAQTLPVLCFSLFAGVVVDRFSKKKIILFTQSASLVITLILAILVWTGAVQYWHILVASAALGFVNTLDMPTRQSFVIEMVGKDDLMNAIALNSSVFNIARIFGPGLAGLVMAYAGVAYCFYLNSFSFAAVIIVMIFIKPVSVKTVQNVHKNIVKEIKDGLTYVKQNSAVLKTIVAVLTIGVFAMNFSVLVPVFSDIVLRQKETGYGFLMSFMGAGSFVGAISVASMSHRGPNKIVLALFPALVGVSLIFTGFTNSYLLAALGIAATGYFVVSFTSTANSTVQFNIRDEEYRGRVMSVYTWVFAGSSPIGNYIAGLVTDHFGPAAGFKACGFMLLLLFALLSLWKGKQDKPQQNCEN